MGLIPDEYRKSGKITGEVKSVVKSAVKPGVGYIEICDLVRREVESRGGRLAFPTGIGVNEVTAHYSPQEGDESVIREEDLVKVDFGVHVDGYVTDTSVSVTYNPEYNILLEATERSLEAAIATARRDQRAGEIGREIHREATRLGFKTIENLTGHTVDRYVVHAGKSIPNLFMPGAQSLKRGDVFAIEPFLTPGTAAGYVIDAPTKTIFSIVSRKKTGDHELDAFADRIWAERKTLPFTPRWYTAELGTRSVSRMVERLVAKKIVRAYPTLVEASGSPVAQFEHTMALDEGGLVVLT
ncbi:MAG: type II methionyl aminopeptidase [Nitrososphaerota archaeon]|nr:type II methionyl aminopeptidase [Nitrososphaerota archaeon]MDG6942856.1 type II methionyl aminopeptidase [Nitrososphaerota archaeon]MDG6950824.1 type II methionyl aminopeptidase [Nitrososphaerota archaeon]